MLQLMPALASVGRASFRLTLVAVPTPSLLTTIVNPTALPAATCWASGTFVTVTCGLPVTQVPVVDVAEPAFWLVTLTVLLRLVAKFVTVWTQLAIVVPPAGAVVGDVMWTDVVP